MSASARVFEEASLKNSRAFLNASRAALLSAALLARKSL